MAGKGFRPARALEEGRDYVIQMTQRPGLWVASGATHSPVFAYLLMFMRLWRISSVVVMTFEFAS
jgi:hypothetical protein